LREELDLWQKHEAASHESGYSWLSDTWLEMMENAEAISLVFHPSPVLVVANGFYCIRVYAWIGTTCRDT
jgi:hypothetical protein